MQILVAARWVHFAALFVLFGCPLSVLLTCGANDAARVFHAADILLRAAAVIAAISGLAWIAALIANMAGGFAEAASPDTLQVFFFGTQFGPVVIIRLILLAAVLLAMFLPRHVRFKAWLLIAAGLLVDQAWLGHAANGGANPIGAMMIAAYAIHVLAGAAWVGGFPVLLFALLAREPGDNAAVLSRYSLLATAAVVLILLSGTANAFFRVQGHIARLAATDYGEILLVKVLLVALMLALACYNRFIALPRLGAAKRQPIASRLTGSIGAELALSVLVIGAAALLGITPPPN